MTSVCFVGVVITVLAISTFVCLLLFHLSQQSFHLDDLLRNKSRSVCQCYEICILQSHDFARAPDKHNIATVENGLLFYKIVAQGKFFQILSSLGEHQR